MKVRNLAIAILLAGLGVGAFALRDYWWPSPTVQNAEFAFAPSGSTTVTQLMVRKIGSSNLLAALGNRPLSWAAIESTNYVVYIQNLRNFGCPEETIRDIIITDIGKLYAKKRAALRAQYPAIPFWQSGESWSRGSESNPELHARLRQLEGEQRALVKSLLGVDMDLEWARFFENDDYDDRRYAFLPPERQQSLHALVAKYDQLEQDLYERTKGMMLQEDQAQLEQLHKMREAEIAQLLSPEEFREYELRNSPVADSLREQLSAFEPNEQEFRKMFDLQKTYEVQLANVPPGSDEEVRSQIAQQAEDALNDEMRKLLGDDRFAEYQRAQDADYKTLVQFADRVNIPRETANRVYDLKTRVEEQRDTIETDPSLSDQQRSIALAALASKATKEVETIMGANAPKYLPVGGQWITDLGAGVTPMQADVSPPFNPAPPRSIPSQTPGFPPFPPSPPFAPALPPPVFPTVPPR